MAGVGATTNKIEHELHSYTGPGGRGFHSHIEKIDRQLTQLKGKKLDQVLGKLDSDHQLNQLDTAFDAPAIGQDGGGLGVGQRQDLFNHLAKDSNGKELSQVFGNLRTGDQQMLVTAIVNNGTPQTKEDFIDDLKSKAMSGDQASGHAIVTVLGSMHGSTFSKALDKLTDPNQKDMAQFFDHLSPSDQKALAQTIAKNGSGQDKLDFVNALKSQVRDGHDQMQTYAGGAEVTTTTEHPQAASIATVLGSMHGKNLDDALKSLDKSGALASVLKDAENETDGTDSFSGGASTGSTFNTKPLVKIIDATADLKDPVEKARVFDDVAKDLPDITSKAQRQQVATALGKLLGSDPEGIVTVLRSIDSFGDGMINYTQELLNEGKSGQDQIGTFIGELRQGKDGKTPLSTYLTQPDHAENLGYFTGSVLVGMRRNSDNEQDRAAQIENIINTAAGVGGNVGSTESQVAVAAANGFTQPVFQMVTDDIKGNAKQQEEAFVTLALAGGKDGGIYIGAGSGIVQRSMDHVVTFQLNADS